MNSLKKISAIIICFVLLFSGVPAGSVNFAEGEVTNLVVNGGFENWTDGKPDSFQTFTPKSAYAQAESQGVDGSTALQATGPSKSSVKVGQLVDVEPGKTYSITYKILDNAGGARTKLFFYQKDASKEKIGGGISGDYSSNGTSWAEMSHTIKVSDQTEFLDVEIRSYNDSSNDLNTDKVMYLDDLSVVKAADKEYQVLDTIEKVRAAAKQDLVQFSGTIAGDYSYKSDHFVFVQDDVDGIAVKLSASNSLPVGTVVSVKGERTENYGYTCVDASLGSVTDTNATKVLPAPHELEFSTVTKDVLNGLEGRRIKIKNFKVASKNKYGESQLVTRDGQNADVLNVKSSSAKMEPGNEYNSVIGTVYFGFGKYLLLPGSDSDIDVDASYTSGLTIPQIQGTSHVSPHNNVNVRDVPGVVTSVIYYEFDRSFKVQGFYMQDETGDGDSKTSDGIFVSTSDLSSIQKGDKVTVTGQVKEVRKDIGDKSSSRYFAYDYHSQLTTTTILAHGVTKTGTGTVSPVVFDDSYALPDLLSSDANMIEVTHRDSGKKIMVGDNTFKSYDPSQYVLDYYESLEGMYIQLNNAHIVGPSRYGAVSVVPNDRKRSLGQVGFDGTYLAVEGKHNADLLTVHTGLKWANGSNISSSESKVLFGAGNKFDAPVFGNVDYEWAAYHIYSADLAPSYSTLDAYKELVDSSTKVAKQEVTSLVGSISEVTVAGYNIYNYDGSKNSDLIAKHFVENFKSPDIIALVEMQDNDGPDNPSTTVVEADQNYGKIIAAIQSLGGPVYAWTDIPPVDDQDGGEPGGNIRVGYLYNPARVQLRSGASKGGSTEAVAITGTGDQTHLTVNPGRILPSDASIFKSTRKSLAAEFVYKGESIFVIANHFNSKRGDTGTFSNIQPTVLGSVEKRVKQAEAINAFVDSIVAADANANVVVLGDMNDFYYSKTLKALEGSGSDKVMSNLIDKLPANDRYTYFFNGVSQVLDNALVSLPLADKAAFDILHLNTKLKKNSTGYASDHEGILMRLGDIGKAEIPNPVKASLPSGEVTANTLITLSAEEGTEIYFKTDGAIDVANPKNNATKYESPITISSDTTISAVAIRGENQSEVASFSYTVYVKPAVITMAEAKSKADGTEVYVEVSTVTSTNVKGQGYVGFADATGAMMMKLSGIANDLDVGTKLGIEATKNTSKYGDIIFKIKKVRVLSEPGEIIHPQEVEPSGVANANKGNFTTVKKARLTKIGKDKYGSVLFTLEKNDQSFVAYIDNRSGVDFGSKDWSKAFEMGQQYDVKGFVVYNGNVPGKVALIMDKESGIVASPKLTTTVQTLKLGQTTSTKEFKVGETLFVKFIMANPTESSKNGMFIWKLTGGNGVTKYGLVPFNLNKGQELPVFQGIGTYDMKPGTYTLEWFAWNDFVQQQSMMKKQSLQLQLKR